ncbi:MAG TPA: cytochrome P450 [Streptosporangiaceae bacterium]
MTNMQPESFPFRLLPGDFGTPVRLYDRACPVSQIKLPSGDLAHMVLDYDEVEQVLKDRRFSRNFRYEGAPRMVLTEDMSLNPDAIVNLDPPEHTRLRRSIQWAFRPANAESWRPKVEQVTKDLLDRVIEAGPPADLVAGFARLLPVRVMCELIDVPTADQEALIGWTGIFFSTAAVSAKERDEASYYFFSYIRDLVADRREHPRDGMIDVLIRACDVDHTLTPAELLQMVIALFIGGQENTSAILARGIFTLLRDRESYLALCADPGLLETAVEEILRYEVASEGAFLRVTTEDIELASGAIPRGTAVQVSLPAANRSDGKFTDPEAFDVGRARNPHLTFGAGAHFCPGAPLARMELRIALGEVVSRLPGLQLAIDPADVRYSQDSLVRALFTLPVSW